LTSLFIERFDPLPGFEFPWGCGPIPRDEIAHPPVKSKPAQPYGEPLRNVAGLLAICLDLLLTGFRRSM